MTNKILTLTRTHYRDDGVFGVLDDEGVPFCVTTEPPWKDNQRKISCAPVGEFPIKRVVSPKFGETFEFIVPNRDFMLFHWGNLAVDLPDDPRDSDGCILLGEKFEPYKTSAVGVLDSKIAFADFMRRMKGFDNGVLIIKKVA